MSDLIERQAAIDTKELVAKIKKGISATNADDVYSCGMRDGMRWCMSLVDGEEPLFENCPSVQPEQRWIPCSERLPDKSGMYLITEQNYGFKVDAICKNVVVHPSYFSVDEKEFKDTVYIPDCSNITAWMPLPEPYMRGEQDAEIR